MSDSTATASAGPVWAMDWLTPIRCRFIFALFITISLLGNLYYLHHCPIDLGGDEAQYWDWSRNLDLSYYSKGPGVAYIIRASCAIFGETMPAVRYPAIVISAAISIVTYLLVRKLFDSDRLALGTALLLSITPIFIVGGVLMTIDPPMFLCWAVATYLGALAIFDRRQWPWVGVGVAIGLGFLTKYVAMVWYVGALGFLISQRRPIAWAMLALGISLLFTIPVLIWNLQHDWASFRHVAQQTGTQGGTFSVGNIGLFIVGMLATVGPTLAWIICGSILHGLRSRDSRLLFLVWIGLPLLVLCGIWSVRTKIQFNWPAPTYFTLIILGAWFLGTRLQSAAMWKPWRGWFWGTILTGIVLLPFARDTSPVLPQFERVAKAIKSDADDFDPLSRLRGWRELGTQVSAQLSDLGDGAFVLCDDYQQTAEMAFYVEGQPKTYCAGFYIGKRMSQYDIWPDRRLDGESVLLGRSAVYVGKGTGSRPPPQIAAAFERVEWIPLLRIVVNGVEVRHFNTWRCYEFKGMKRPNEGIDY